MPSAALQQRRPEPARNRVPAQNIGQARGFRVRVINSYGEWDSGIERLLAPFRGKNTSPLSRRTLLKQLPAAWRSLAPFGRLRLHVADKTGGPVISEVRLAPTSLLQGDWTGPESAVAIVLFSLRVEPHAVGDKVRVLAMVGQHALSRRYQRAEYSDSAVLTDLQPIVTAWPTVIRRPGDFTVPAGSGIWRGETVRLVLNGEAMTVMSVRTFVN
jgi:hypothetical protein